MSLLSTITVTLKDEAAESTFVEAFSQALEATRNFSGLEKLVAAKVLGNDRTYHLHTEWATAEQMAAWQDNPLYRAVRDSFEVSLVENIDIKRWTATS